MLLLIYVMAKSTEFELLAKIGEGGMGEVYRARLFNKHGFEKIVAAKKVIGTTTDKSFMREAEVLSKLNHPNICSVFDIKEFDGNLYILMEYIDGLSLSDIQEVSIQKGYKFREEFISQVAFQVLKGLEYAHASLEEKPSIIHRDISPQNIMVSQQGNVKILDFGIAKIETTHLTSKDSTYGKVRYCAPEVLNGKSYDQRSDLYALGVLLFELSIGAKAFNEQSEVQIIAQKENNELSYSLITSVGHSRSLQIFIEKLSASNTTSRFQSAKDALTFILQHNLINTSEVSGSILVDEIENLKSSGICRTKTIVNPTREKVVSRKKIVVATALTSCLILFGLIYSQYVKTNWRHLDFQVQSEGKLVKLEHPKNDGRTEIGGELGLYMSDFNCVSAINSFISFSSGILSPDIEKKFNSFGIKRKPSQFLRELILDYQQTEFLLDFLKINCSQNKTFNKGVIVYQDIYDALLKEKEKEYQSWKELQDTLRPKVFFRAEKFDELYGEMMDLGSNEKIYHIRNQLEKIQTVHAKVLTGFQILFLDEKVFPKNLLECRDLIEYYWVVEAMKKTLSSNDILNFSAIVIPAPNDGEIVKYGPDFLEYKDNSKAENSNFRKHGVCVFKRYKGEVVESSLRKL